MLVLLFSTNFYLIEKSSSYFLSIIHNTYSNTFLFKLDDDEWEIIFATPIYGWDVIVECSFKKLKDLDKIGTFYRIE